MRHITSHLARATQAAVVLLALQAVNAQANEALARKHGCLACHSVATKIVGPAYKDVAARYAGQDGALEQLQTSIREGSTGKWGELAMPPHAAMPPADIKKLAQWVLGLK